MVKAMVLHKPWEPEAGCWVLVKGTGGEKKKGVLCQVFIKKQWIIETGTTFNTVLESRKD